MAMTAPVLHYLYDPFCGWCYAAALLLRVARRHLAVQGHGGGMMAGKLRQRVSPQLRQYVMPHDRRIAQLTGQPFGEAYFDGLLRDATAVFDSAPPIAAILAADELAQRGLDLLGRLQTAHYVEGRRIAELPVLIALAEEIGLPAEPFATRLSTLVGAAVDRHIAASRALLSRVGGSGFPSFVLEQQGRFTVLDAAAYFGRPEAWAAALRQQIPSGQQSGQIPTLACPADGSCG